MSANPMIQVWAATTEREIQRRALPARRAIPARDPLPHGAHGRYFDGEVQGLEHVPPRGPVLLVGNHSGGILTPDTTVVFAAWYRHFGLERPLVGLAFDAAFGLPGFRDVDAQDRRGPGEARQRGAGARRRACGAGLPRR